LKQVIENIESYCYRFLYASYSTQALIIIIPPNERVEIFMGLSPGISKTSKVLLEIDK
jgi:hypothetical protein